MTIQAFLSKSGIPFYKIWYYISDTTGKKTPIGEKNNIQIEDIPIQEKRNQNKPKSIFVKSNDPSKKYDEIPLSQTEIASLQQAYTIFLKYTDNIYCVDIDDKEINSMDDFIQKTGCTIFKDCCWTQGNTKGIHIYTKINNMIEYSNQQNVYNNFVGDLIKKNNMWEKTDKIVNNWENGISELEYENIKDIFNENINKQKPQKLTTLKIKTPSPPPTTPSSPTSVAEIHLTEEEKNMDDIDYLLHVCIRDSMCQEHQDWITIGQALKNELGDDAIDYFVRWTYAFGSENKKKEAVTHITKYIKKTPLKEKKRLTLKRVHLKARENNEEKYVERFCKPIEQVENDLISELIFSSTDYDFANYFVKKWGTNFKCVDIGKKDVYHFTEQNIWDNNFTCGSKIREMISNEMWSDFANFQQQVVKEAEQYDPNTDEYEKTNRKIKLISDICVKLKKTSDKNNILKEILDKIEDPNFEKDLNKQKYILPIKNGKIIDMNTLEIQERTIEHKFNYECDADYIEMTEEEEKDIKQYFLDLFCGNEDTMLCVLDILKSIFTGETLRYIYFFTGEGSNGKSLLFSVLKKIFVKAMDTIDTRVILESKSASSLTTEFEKLDKCRLGLVTELDENDKLNVKTIKKISGGDHIDYRGLYKSNQTIIPTLNLGVVTNVLPDFTAQTAIINRIIVVPFNNTFEVNKSFETELLGKKNQIFTFIMKYGTIRDKFELTEEMKVAKQDYVDNNEKIDYLKDYIDAFYEIVPFVKKEKKPRDEFRDGYNAYLKSKGQPMDKSTNNKFTKDIKKYNIGTKESNGKTFYTGLIERVEETDDDDL